MSPEAGADTRMSLWGLSGGGLEGLQTSADLWPDRRDDAGAEVRARLLQRVVEACAVSVADRGSLDGGGARRVAPCPPLPLRKVTEETPGGGTRGSAPTQCGWHCGDSHPPPRCRSAACSSACSALRG